MSAWQVLRIIANLLSEDGENPEYDRACVEIACAVIGVSTDHRTRMLVLLRLIRTLS